MYKPNLVSPCHKVKVKVEPKKDLVDATGKTFYFVCSTCHKACNPITNYDIKYPAQHIGSNK